MAYSRLSLSGLFVLCVIVLWSARVRADCPNIPDSSCGNAMYGAIGWRGTCWKWDKLKCEACGPLHCPPPPPTSWRAMPHKTQYACLQKVLTVTGQVNGCSNPLRDPLSQEYKKLFHPACDLHDMCYHNSGVTKATCDTNFKLNADSICDSLYPGTWNSAQKLSCKAASHSWYAVIVELAQPNFDRSQFWAKQNCG